MIIRIFDVNAGSCALIITDERQTILIDCHRNSTTGWEPAGYLLNQGITKLDMLVITNTDEDHCSGLPELFENIEVRQILRNNSLSPQQMRALKDEGGIGRGVEALASALEKKFTGTVTAAERVGGASFSWTAKRLTPAQMKDDSNNLSLVFQAKCSGVPFLFPGDLECKGWDLLRDDVKDILGETQVLIAPHHGRENAHWDGFKELMKQLLVTVISDKGYMHSTQEEGVAFYRDISQGVPFGGGTRYVLTTRNDGSIEFRRTPQGWSIATYDESYAGKYA